MSLITGASVWNPDESISNRRVPSMRPNNKTMKKMPGLDPIPTNDDIRPSTFEEDRNNQDQRNDRVSQMLNNMSSVMQSNDGDKLANFNPMPSPQMQTRSDFLPSGRDAEPDLPVVNNVLQLPPPNVNQQSSDFSPNMMNVDNSPYQTNPHGNLRRVYEPSRMMPSNANPVTAPVIDNRIIEKINYAIHLLEQQQNEKTSNMFEEFVLYTLLGVFLIYIIDSFSKSAKYIR